MIVFPVSKHEAIVIRWASFVAVLSATAIVLELLG